MKSVAVLMSVYDGEQYITEQIDSILSQQGVDVTIYIRDDGSGPAARALLQQWSAHHANIVVSYGPNLGIKDSFLKMVHDVPDTHDYYAFSDSDDVWLSRKLLSAVEYLASEDPTVAHAYCSQMTLVDAELTLIRSGRRLNRPITFANALVECRMQGATAVFNRKLIGIARTLDYSDATMHDAWMNLIATGFGQVHFDPTSYILYRQHGANADGGMWSVGRTWRARLTRSTLVARLARQAQAFLTQVRGDLDAEREAALMRLIRYNDRELSPLHFLFDRGLQYQRSISKVLTAISLLSSAR